MTAGGRRLGGGETEQKGKRTQDHGQQCGGERSIKGLNGNEKNNKNLKKKIDKR